MIALLVMLAGGAGSIARFGVDAALRPRLLRRGPRVPWPTMLINVSGSLVLGLLAGLVIAGVPAEFSVVLGTGFLGGYTTFSTAMVETARLVQQRQWSAALINGVGMLVLGVAAAAAGLALGQRL